jgi:hypothetical protein
MNRKPLQMAHQIPSPHCRGSRQAAKENRAGCRVSERARNENAMLERRHSGTPSLTLPPYEKMGEGRLCPLPGCLMWGQGYCVLSPVGSYGGGSGRGCTIAQSVLARTTGTSNPPARSRLWPAWIFFCGNASEDQALCAVPIADAIIPTGSNSATSAESHLARIARSVASIIFPAHDFAASVALPWIPASRFAKPRILLGEPSRNRGKIGLNHRAANGAI